MKGILERTFKLGLHETSPKQEVLAGVTSFFTIVYIMIVNASILSDAGIPLEAGILATVLVHLSDVYSWHFGQMHLLFLSRYGCKCILHVHSCAYAWTNLARSIGCCLYLWYYFCNCRFYTNRSRAISINSKVIKGSDYCRHRIIFSVYRIAKGGLVVSNPNTAVAMGKLSNPVVLATLLTLIIALVLFIRNVRGNFYGRLQ